MILFPPAKINLGLNVLHKREDGYHEIESCMYQIPLFDSLEILKSDTFKFIQTGLTVDSEQEDNLVVKAFRLMQERFSIGNVYMHLLKSIPMGAGLGGGSADATYVILELNTLFELNLSNNEMRKLAGELGSDCPLFVEKGVQIAKGRGEVLENLNFSLHGKFLKIVNPGIHIGTKEAYANIEFSHAKSIVEVLAQPIETWKTDLTNSFESTAFRNHPEIEPIKNQLYSEGAEYASMTGSGSTLFGIYSKEPEKSFPMYYEKVLKF